MPEIDFSTPIIDPQSGKPVHSAEMDEDLDLGKMIYVASMGNLKGDENIQAGRKVAMGALALKVLPGGVQTFKVEQIAMMKDRIERAFPPAIAALGWQILDPEPSDG